MSHMKNEAQQAAISACGKNDLQYASGFTNPNDPQVYSGTPNMLVSGILIAPQPKYAWLTRIASSWVK